MAIGLDELKQNKTLKKNQSRVAKNKALRPWESNDNVEYSIRTIGAVEAVRKAKDIVEKNNEMIGRLHEKDGEEATSNLHKFANTENMKKELELRLEKMDRDSLMSENLNKNAGKRPGFISFIKNLFSS